MNQALVKTENKISTVVSELDGIEKALIEGDLAGLSQAQRIEYVTTICKAVGLNPATVPFTYLQMGGKTVLYANKNCTEQLRDIHKVSIDTLETSQIEDERAMTERNTSDNICTVCWGSGLSYKDECDECFGKGYYEQVCDECGEEVFEGEGLVCDECYSKYTPGQLADLEG